ncbi:MAG: M42 family metallopeptidase [Clostridiales bacterium]|nr:M42 family metallopeptidase [Clostridiales bacterium]
MQVEEFLRSVTALPGLTGQEGQVAEYIAAAFRPYADEVKIDRCNNVIAHVKGDGPRLQFCAHLDEIGLMVSKIEEDGCLRLRNVGGVDPRIMPGMQVQVYGKRQLTGVIGAKAPHLLSQEEREQNYKREDLYVDLGMPAPQVRELVQVGDLVALEARYVNLQNGRIATKTADDRACVAILYRAMQLLRGMKHKADLYFVATCQEEIGSYGAAMTAFSIQPDYGIALDVCHAHTPGAPSWRTHELDALVASTGPFVHSMVRRKLMETAKQNNIQVQTAVVPRSTFTDADSMNIQRGGIPTALLELPLKYMHTAVEVLDMHTLEEGARLLAHFACAAELAWEDELWT